MPGVSPAGIAPKGTVTRFCWSLLPGSDFTHQPPCLPSLHRFVLPGFTATMKALTSGPVGPRTSDGPLGGAGSVRTTSLGATRAGSPCLSRLNFRPFRLQPPHCHFTTLGLTRYITGVIARAKIPYGHQGRRNQRHTGQGSTFARSLPDRLGRIEFVMILRTGRSLQVAPHPSFMETQLPLSVTDP
jgi:hypothetical protein